MGLFDIFTGDAYKDAAAKQQQYLQGVSDNIAKGIASTQVQGLGALQSGQYGATNAVQGGINQARSDIGTFSPEALNFLLQQSAAGGANLAGAQSNALGALSSGVQQAQGAYQPLLSAAQRYGTDASQASQASADALGLNGPEGIARSRATFQAGPGFQFAQEQGLESILRNANRAGMAPGGNQLLDAQKFGIGQGQQAFGDYQSRLAAREGLYAPLEEQGLATGAGGVANAALTGGTGAANIITGTGQRLADLASRTGATGAGIIQGQGASLADLAARGGLAEGNIAQTGGQNIADLLKALQQMSSTAQTTIAPTYAKSFDTAAAGSTMGSNNLWNLIGGIAKFGSGTSLGSSALGSLGLSAA
jgi:hypothetical protein